MSIHDTDNELIFENYDYDYDYDYELDNIEYNVKSIGSEISNSLIKMNQLTQQGKISEVSDMENFVKKHINPNIKDIENNIVKYMDEVIKKYNIE